MLDKQQIAEKLEAAAAADEARHALFQGGSIWGVTGKDPMVRAAIAAAESKRRAADAAFDQAAGMAVARIREIEVEANAAERAVLDAHAEELERLRATKKAAEKVRHDANEAAGKPVHDAEEAFRVRKQVAYNDAVAAERKANVELVLAALGGVPVHIPTEPLHYGSQRRVEVWPAGRISGGPHLIYRLKSRSKYGNPDARLSLAVPLPDGLTQSWAEIETVVREESETIPEAIRKVEDAAIAEGWLIRNEGGK